MKFWQLGNTSVRSALRIRDGLVALSKSPIQGNIRNTEGDIAFRELLGEYGIVSLGRDVTNSVGRKWRSAMAKLGFIYPEIIPSMGFSQDDLGPLDYITESGRNLINAQTIQAIQECFLRAMITPTIKMGSESTFSPLCWVLALMLNLEKRLGDASISFLEMAVIVIVTNPADGLENVTNQIIEMRHKRNDTQYKRAFDREMYDKRAKEVRCLPSTFKDYADMNIRYLKATGMVQAKGKGISLVPEKHTLAVQMTRSLEHTRPLLDIYRELCKGSELPTDHSDMAIQVLEDLLPQAQQYAISYSLEGKMLDTPAQINQVRYEIEQLIFEKKEEYFGCQQAFNWEEIAVYLDMLARRSERFHVNDETELRIPKAEAPAYLEWSLWRAFLAINNLVNKPHQVRRFSIDQDFMPVSTAPGGGPDLIVEFKDKVIVIEATLSESSRQEAMEGEPVRRHVADYLQKSDKPVYGLFIANKVDSNTAETFRIGRWYTNEDRRLNLSIVPLTLQQFLSLFRAMFEKDQVDPEHLFNIILECDVWRIVNKDIRTSDGVMELGAPQWKAAINEIVNSKVSALQ